MRIAEVQAEQRVELGGVQSLRGVRVATDLRNTADVMGLPTPDSRLHASLQHISEAHDDHRHVNDRPAEAGRPVG